MFKRTTIYVMSLSIMFFVLSHKFNIIFYQPSAYFEKPSIPLVEIKQDVVDIQALELKRLARLAEDEYVKKTILITNYYVGDSTGSGMVTSSGLGIKSFGVNELGWYTYKGKVVVATATYRCLRVKTGPCGKYNTIPDDYEIFNIYDELILIYKGVEYPGIVLDSCGACMVHINNEKYQRYDVFLSSTATKFGKVLGELKIKRVTLDR